MTDRITLRIDPDLEDLIPGFLANRRKDVEKLRHLVNEVNFSDIRLIGHSMKGVGGGYGFDAITVYGGEIERAALAEDVNTIVACTAQLESYLDRIDIVFGD